MTKTNCPLITLNNTDIKKNITYSLYQSYIMAEWYVHHTAIPQYDIYYDINDINMNMISI